MDDFLEIVPLTPELKPWFERLNLEWLEQFFFVEEIDKLVLRHPEEQIIAGGGVVLFARYRDAIVGTCAIKHHGNGRYELIKMAITATVQGKGFGRSLLDAAIRVYRDLTIDNPDSELFLESHHSLRAALKLYETGGFRHAQRPSGPVAYARSDIYMVLVQDT